MTVNVKKYGGKGMDRDELKGKIEDLMQQYSDEKIDGSTYAEKMMELATKARDEQNKNS